MRLAPCLDLVCAGKLDRGASIRQSRPQAVVFFLGGDAAEITATIVLLAPRVVDCVVSELWFVWPAYIQDK